MICAAVFRKGHALGLGVHPIEDDDHGQSLAGFREQIVYLVIVLLGHDNVGPPGTCFGI
jgi:hypothetical protein